MSEDTLRISVAMCTYNGARFVRAQLASILRQTRPPDELVICDDGSIDGTPDVVRSTLAQSAVPASFHINDRRLGASKNFEQAINACTGDIIFLADQDDIWLPEKIAETMSVFRTHGDAAGLVFSDGEVIDGEGHPRGYRLWQSFHFTRHERQLVNRGRALDVLLKHNVVTGAAAAFRAEYKSLVAPLPDIGIHDGWIALLIAAAAGLRTVERPLIRYRQHRRNQVGASRPTMSHMVAVARKPGSQVYADQGELAQRAAMRLAAWGDSSEIEDARERLEERAQFARYRAYIPKNRLARVGCVLSRVLSGHYRRYAARAFHSAASDLVRPD